MTPEKRVIQKDEVFIKLDQQTRDLFRLYKSYHGYKQYRDYEDEVFNNSSMDFNLNLLIV